MRFNPMSFFKHDKAIVHPDAKIGVGTRIWANTNIQAGAQIGEGCNICDGSFVEKGAVVGNHCTIKHYVSVFAGVTLEDYVFVGSNIAFINDRHPRSGNKEWKLEKTLVKEGATLGTNAVILCGLTIGSYAFVGAGSVVTKDVPDYALVVGNPARKVGYACQCGRKLDAKYSCKNCGKKYKKGKKGLELKV